MGSRGTGQGPQGGSLIQEGKHMEGQQEGKQLGRIPMLEEAGAWGGVCWGPPKLTVRPWPMIADRS